MRPEGVKSIARAAVEVVEEHRFVPREVGVGGFVPLCQFRELLHLRHGQRFDLCPIVRDSLRVFFIRLTKVEDPYLNYGACGVEIFRSKKLEEMLNIINF